MPRTNATPEALQTQDVESGILRGGKVLIVDDSPTVCQFLTGGLGGFGFQSISRSNAEEALTLLAEEDFDAVVTDLHLTGMSGLELCEKVVANRPDVPMVLITAYGDLDSAVRALRLGVYDFIPKPVDPRALAFALEGAIARCRLRTEVRRLQHVMRELQGDHDIIGESPKMRQLMELIDRVADADTSVLITGESGTGKELVARALHKRSKRRTGPFVAINCSAFPESLLESEIFGHMRGAFTDAKADRTGLFLQAHHGTLFLDEVTEMSLPLQPKLLRVLQERTFRPVGGDTEVKFDARIVSATNADVEEVVRDRRFREDLFFRLNVVRLQIPPLRERGSDILLLAQHFLRQFASRSGKEVCGISSDAAQRLLSYQWPGNVRELQNCIEHSVTVTSHDQILVKDLPDSLRNGATGRLSAAPTGVLVPMEEVEKRHILFVVNAVGGNLSEAARVLHLDRKTLTRKLSRYRTEGEPVPR